MKLSRSIFILVLLLLVSSLVLVACGGDETTTTTAGSTDTTAAGEETTTTAPAEAITVKIGAAGPFTGQLAKIGTDALNAITVAVEDFNASGAMPGVTFVVEVADDAADPAKAATVAEKLASDDSVVGVVGPMTSSAVQAALPILEEAGLSLVTQSATNDDLSSGGFTVFHRIAPKDAVQGPSIAQFMVEDLAVKKVYIIDDKGTYSQGLADNVEAALKAAGGVTIERAQITPEDKDFAAVLTKVKAFAPDVLFMPIPSPAQAAAVAKQAQSAGITVQLMGADGTKDPTEYIANAGGATEGAYATSLGPMPEVVPAAKEFLDRFVAQYKETSLFTAQSYEATMVLLDAVKRAGVVDGKIDRTAVNDALAETNYTGILGFPIAFSPEGDLAAGGVYIIQVKGDKFEQIKAIELP
ncbi:MAG: branched-chain amino acid ABC transporter substrate-binding protein [Thermoleophilia bacterium]